MYHSHSRSAMTAFLLTLLATDAVFGGVVQVQRASLSISKDEHTAMDISKDFSDASALDSDHVNSVELNRPAARESSNDSALQKSEPSGDALLSTPLETALDRVMRAMREPTGKRAESANAALNAVAFLAASAATALATPLVNNLPGYINNGIVGFASVINSMAMDASAEKNATLTEVSAYNETSRQARDYPAYGADGVVHSALAWLRDEEMKRADFMAENPALLSTLRGPNGGRLPMEPILSAFGFLRRTIALQFMATMMVMTVAHLARIMFMNLPQILSIFGLGRQTSRRVQEAVEEMVPPDWSTENSDSSNVDFDLLRGKAENLAKQLIAAVTRDQCAERSACVVGLYCSQYSYTPSVMRLLRSPEPEKEKPDHPVWLAFRDAAEGKVTFDDCNQQFKC